MTLPSWYQWRENTLLINVLVQPRASKDEVVGIFNNRLKIRITAPPIDNKANTHLTRFLAKEFKVAKSSIKLLRGQTGREKQFQIQAPKQLPAYIPNN